MPNGQRQQCKLLGINRGSLYFKPLGEPDLNLELMKKIDRIHLEQPTFGVLRMQDELGEPGHSANHKRVRCLMRKININAIYPKPNLSRPDRAKYIHPHLLRDLDINRANQVRAIAITYIPMKKGFMYLTAVMDVYRRYPLGWELSNSLEEENRTELVEGLFKRYGTPAILNSDQRSQYTCNNWTD